MLTSISDMTVNRSPVARAQRAGLIPDSVPRMTGAARGILLFLLVAVVVGGAVWGYLGKSDTEPSADLDQMMEQAAEGASEATDAASEAVESVTDAASEGAKTTEETIAAVGEEIQTQTDTALDGVAEATDSAGQAVEQAAESASESLGALGESAPDTSTSATESASEITTESFSEPLSGGEPVTTAPEIV